MPTAGTFTEDTLLDGRVKLTQPQDGYRVAIDPVLLAAAVPAQANERVFEIGAGSGAAALCLAARVAGVAIDGIEMQPDLLALAERNVRQNGVAARLRILPGDLLDPPAALREGAYDHVMANPPHLPASGSAPRDAERRLAHREGTADLADWVRFAGRMAKEGATLTFLHRFDRLDELLDLLGACAGDLRVLPLCPMAGRPAKRVLVQGRKGAPAGTARADARALHDAAGAYTPELEAVLRKGAALSLDRS
ncbi:MAG: methyltransferase [Alphaproteobacteria bacterium]|nr:methyltransferase [Alphaproteobacteria bacterium]